MSEIESVEQLHRAAQARLGLAVSLLSQDRWSSVQASRPKQGADRWATSVAEAVMQARLISLSLARTYYRLARAIETGFTLGPENEPTTIGRLRDEFLADAMRVATIGNEGEATPFHALYTSDIADGALEQVDILPLVQTMLDESQIPDTRAVRIEPHTWATVASGDEILEQIKRTLKGQTVDPLEKEISKISRKDIDQKAALAQIEDAHTRKGKLGAGKADEFVMRAGRAQLNHVQGRDRRVLKFARGTGPNPCGFCAMLASRGFVFNSRRSAGSTSNGAGGFRSYHPNCHCFPIARWVEQSPLPALNVYFQDLWNTEIRGKYSGDVALNKWRKLIERKRREGTIPAMK